MSHRILRTLAAAALLAVIAPAGALARGVAPLPVLPRAQVTVQVRTPGQFEAVRAAVERAGGRVERLLRWNAMVVTPAAGVDATSLASAVAAVPGVQYASRAGVIRPAATVNDPYFPQQWGLPAIGAPAAWDYSTGTGVAIAELDTGIDYNHEDLIGRVVPYHNYFDPTKTPLDDDPDTHGTHVAGIMAANHNWIDVAGTAPGATVYAFKVMGLSGGQMVGSTTDLAQAIWDAADLTPCRIITMSLGASATDGGNDPAVRAAIDHARAKGLLVVAAAGNLGPSLPAPAPFYPAAYPGVIGVGSVDQGLTRSSFSNTYSGIVDLAAPGDAILSTVSWTSGEKVGYMSGTSMAAPFVSATAAMVMSRFPSIDATQVASLLESTAQDLGPAGYDASFGFGLVRADRAVLAAVFDAYEPDDTTATAHPFALGSSSAHALFPAGEVDYASVVLTAGRSYAFETTSLLAGADTAIAVLGPGGSPVIASNDDRAPGVRSSLVAFTAPVTGRYFVRVTDPHSLGGSYTLVLRDTTASQHVVRLAGMTRYDTAVLIAKDAYPGWTGVRDLVLASGEDRAAADPLSAAGLCALYRAPLLITRGLALSPEVAGAIAQMPPGLRVHIVGGTGSVRPAVAASLAALPNVASVERIAGLDRYDLAAAVAARIQVEASVPPTVALVANGADPKTFFDALALSAVSARTGFPILLVRATAVPPVTASRLASIAPSQVWVAGGPATVGNGVFASLHATGRWWGATRYDTALAVANGAIAKGWLRPDRVALAAKLPDALTGGSSLGVRGTPVLVTWGGGLLPQPASFLTARRLQLWGAAVLGGTGSISTGVETSVRQALR